MLRNLKHFTNLFRAPIPLNRNKYYCTDEKCTPGIVNQVTKVKSEEEIQNIISNKVKEYQELLNTHSLENKEMCSEIDVLDSKLRKSYGFQENEDLTAFPVFKFEEPVIDDQLDSEQKTK